jgi:hypothetical protein
MTKKRSLAPLKKLPDDGTHEEINPCTTPNCLKEGDCILGHTNPVGPEYMIYCDMCVASGPYMSTKQEAIREWNRRNPK